ncbi:MAG: hypothetical protein LUO96_01900 [Methanomicrobiales archaeon]|nr:hypothetical protein [Methanomicrobiales archaeon]
MSRTRPFIILVALVTALALLAGCTGGWERGPPQATPSPGEETTGVTITSPADGAVLPAGDIAVSVRVTNFTLVPEYGQPFVSGEGHLHYYMSVGSPEPGGTASTAAPISYAATTDTSYTWHDVSAGMYTFTVELANNDHSPFQRPASASVTVRVTGELPAGPTGTAPGGGGDTGSCVTDSDCVPEQCCHPTSCINSDYKGVCTLLCTNVCQGPIDCGAGHCGCVDGSCSVVPGPSGP